MPIVLYRVDERLIHGQVTVGWGSHLRPTRYLVVDDALARCGWEQELYALGAPPESEVLFLDVLTARRQLEVWKAEPGVSLLLTRGLAQMRALGEDGGLAGQEVNLGGIHDAPGRKQILPYLFLSGDDQGHIRALIEGGAHVMAQNLPGAPRASVRTLLEE